MDYKTILDNLYNLRRAAAYEAAEQLKQGIATGEYGDTLEDVLFNQHARVTENKPFDWINEYANLQTFHELITSYENEMHGQRRTDLNDLHEICRVALFIAGEYVLNQCTEVQYQEQYTQELSDILSQELYEDYNLDSFIIDQLKNERCK